MQFFDAVKIAFQKYADFRGVASRPEYWWFTLFVFLVGLIAGSIDTAIGKSNSGPIQTVLSFALFLPQITMMVRRNRDAGFSAWWLTLLAVPLVVTIGSVLAHADLIRRQFAAVDEVESISVEQGLEMLKQLAPVLVPILIAFVAVGIFFFVVSLLPTKKPKQQPAVATIDY